MYMEGNNVVFKETVSISVKISRIRWGNEVKRREKIKYMRKIAVTYVKISTREKNRRYKIRQARQDDGKILDTREKPPVKDKLDKTTGMY
jgi:hypothetical protein